MTTSDEIIAALERAVPDGSLLDEAADLIRQQRDIIGYERALADALAKVIATNFNVNRGTFIWEEDTPVPDVVTVMARYREARG